LEPKAKSLLSYYFLIGKRGKLAQFFQFPNQERIFWAFLELDKEGFRTLVVFWISFGIGEGLGRKGRIRSFWQKGLWAEGLGLFPELGSSSPKEEPGAKRG